MMPDDLAFRLLLTRLDAPARLVRLLAAREIGALLARDGDGALRSLYLDWFSRRPLESSCVDAAIPIGLSGPRLWTDLSTFTRAGRPSILLDILAGEMFGRRPAFRSWLNAHSREPPRNFEPPEHFALWSSRHLAPVYLRVLRDADRRTSGPFLLRQYAWEYTELKRLTGLPDADFSYFFDSDDKHLSQHESATSALYLSAYLRAIHFGVAQREMPLVLAEHAASFARPAHLRLAVVGPRMPPAGWPCFDDDPTADAWFEAIGGDDPGQIRDGDSEWIVAAASALVHQSDDRWIMAEVNSAWTAGRLPQGPVLPAASGLDVGGDGDALLPQRLRYPISRQQASFPSSERLLASNATAHPFPGRWHLDVIDRCGVAPVLPVRHEPVEVEYEGDGIWFRHEGCPIARWIHWYHRWTMSHPKAHTPASGAALMLSRSIIAQMEAKAGAGFQRVVTATSHPRGRRAEGSTTRSVRCSWPVAFGRKGC